MLRSHPPYSVPHPGLPVSKGTPVVGSTLGIHSESVSHTPLLGARGFQRCVSSQKGHKKTRLIPCTYPIPCSHDKARNIPQLSESHWLRLNSSSERVSFYPCRGKGLSG